MHWRTGYGLCARLGVITASGDAQVPASAGPHGAFLPPGLYDRDEELLAGSHRGEYNPQARVGRLVVFPTEQPCSALQFFASMLTYPFVLVSNLMAVNNCG